jgi:hypothetical protein
MDAAVTLPTHRPQLLCESLLNHTELEPMARLSTMRFNLKRGAYSAGGRSTRAHIHTSEEEITLGRPIGTHLCDAGASQGEWEELHQRMAFLAQDTARAEEGSFHGGVLSDETQGPGPAGRDALFSPAHMRTEVLNMLEGQSVIEEFIENRFLSAERLLAFLVLFHQMAQTVATALPMLRWDTACSQSLLRVATTAAPVSAADLVRTWQAGRDAGLDDSSFHGGVGAFVEAEATEEEEDSSVNRRLLAAAAKMRPLRGSGSAEDLMAMAMGKLQAKT